MEYLIGLILAAAVAGSATVIRTSKDDLKDRLARYRQIKITVIGRKSGRTIFISEPSLHPFCV